MALIDKLYPQPKEKDILSDAVVDLTHLIGQIPLTFGQRLDESRIVYVQDKTIDSQGYQLTTGVENVQLSYADEHGLLYGHYCLAQLLDIFQAKLPELNIKDWPSFDKRGVILDISRDRVPTNDTLFKLIDFWSELRINQVQLYTEHTFAYKNHQTAWDGYSPMLPEEIQALDKYCISKGIELIPNQATFGHMEKWLCHPEYHDIAEQTSGFYDQRGDYRPESFGLNPVNPKSAQFVDELFAELLPNFTSDTLNINFDETMDLGVDGSQQACEEQGHGKVYLNYLTKILDLAANRGKRCQIFSDMLFRYPDLLPYLPKDLELLNWGYEEDHPYDEEHQKLSGYGYPFQVVVSTNTFASIAGRRQAARVHMQRAAISAKKFGAKGYQISEWGDMGYGQAFFTALPHYVFGACVAWDHESKLESWADFVAKHFGKEFIGLESLINNIQDAYLTSGVTTPNCAYYGPFVFDQRSRRHIRRADIADKEVLQQAQEYLTNLTNELLSQPATWLSKQIAWTLECMKVANQIAIEYQQSGTRELEQLDDQAKERIAERLSGFKLRYQNLWLQHYREGGLKQSSSRLTLLEELCKTNAEQQTPVS